MANYIVSGAGSGGNFNGTFVFASGSLYENSVDSNYVLVYDSGLSQWTIRHFSSVYYYNTASAGSPPLTGWLTSLGSAPAPTIAIIPPPKLFGTKNLFLKSAVENSVSLYIRNNVFNSENSVSLYIRSVIFDANILPLHLKVNTQEQTDLYLKAFPQSSINLFIKYWYEHQDNQELYLKAFLEASTNLFIKNIYLYTETYNSIDFNIQSSTTNQKINSVELYIKSFFENNLELFLMVDYKALTTNFISTYISGQIVNQAHFESLNLYLGNNYTFINNSLNITIIGLGTTFNAIPHGSSMQMFIQRNVEATWNHMPLIAYGASSTITSSIDFNIYPNDIYFYSVGLVIPKINQSFNGNMQLYTHGFED